MKRKVAKLTIDEVTPERLIEVFIRTVGFEEKPLNEYTQSELILLLTCAADICSETILNNLGVIGTNLQEQLDQLAYSAKKDSTSSSMRPSSDMPRRRKDSEGESTESDEQTEDKSAGEAADNHTEGNPGNGENADSDEEQSEEQFRKNKSKGFRTPSGKPVGRQPGTTGCRGFQIPDNATRNPEQIIPPKRCVGCPKWEECLKTATLGPCHNVIDVEFSVTVTPYRNVEVNCPEPEVGEEPIKKSEYPENVKGTNQYGVQIATLVACLYCVGMTSLRRIQDILSPMLHMTLSPATMLKFIDSLAGKIANTVDSILDQLYWEGHVHCDETGGKINGEIHWLHSICTETFTFLSIQKERGRKGMDKIGFLLMYTGTVIHDCWSSYWSYLECSHAICNEHILRELKGLSAFFKHASEWADEMASLLREMLHKRHLAEEDGKDHVEQHIIDQFSNRFDEIIAKGKELHPIPEREPGKRGRIKRGRARALIDRMELRKDEIFRFITDFSIPFSNNIAEASFRIFAVKRGEMGSFRSFEDAEHFVAIMAYLSTARKHGISYYEAVKEGFMGNSDSLIFPEGLPKKRPCPITQEKENESTEEHEKMAS